MTTTIIKGVESNFTWETASYFQYFKQAVHLETPFSNLLLQEMQAHPTCHMTLCKVVAYLASHSHFTLEQALKDNLAKVSSEQQEEVQTNLQAVAEFSLASGRLEMLDVCRRVISLDLLKKVSNTNNVSELAADEALFIPKPKYTIEKISGSIFKHWQQYSNTFGKVIHCFYAIFIGTAVSFKRIVNAPLSNPPSLFEVKNYIDAYRYFYKSLSFIGNAYINYFSTTRKAAEAGVLILSFITGIYYLHHKYHLGVPEKIDPKGSFHNTSNDSQDSHIYLRGRQTEFEEVELNWNIPEGQKFKFVALVGPPGCGKTAFVDELAWKTKYDKNSFIYGKTLFKVNTIQLAKEGDYYWDNVLKTVEGHEKNIVFFFDEGHSAGNQPGKIAPLLEYLKTKLLEKNIRCIIATTNQEYKDYIGHNAAFVDRCRVIYFEEPSDKVVIEILKDNVETDVNRIAEVDPNAYEAMLFVTHNQEEYKKRINPRKAKDLYNALSSYVSGWIPKKLSKQKDDLMTKEASLITSILTANKDKNWSLSSAGKAAIAELKQIRIDLQKLIERQAFQTLEFQNIVRLRALQPVYRKQYHQITHAIADSEKPFQGGALDKAHKEFLFLKHILTPALERIIQSSAATFKKTFDEIIPLKIDAELIRNRYPQAFELASVESPDINR